MKLLKGLSVLLFSLLLWILVQQYLLCPQYIFTAGRPFSGPNWYNPYQGIDADSWVKCNFHAHTKAWMGITNGKGNAEDVWREYEKLGYGIHCVSDYEKINTAFQEKPNYISAYEHGYNILKTHQLVLGDVDVVGLDYFFPQTRSNKQDLLRRLSANRNNLVIVNHPTVRTGYSKDDFMYLSNFHCMEIASPYQTSLGYWDQVLSSGKPVFAVANDDIHNIFDKRGIGRFFTCVNTAEIGQKQILDAFKRGKHFTMIAADLKDESDDARTERLKMKMPGLSSFAIVNDSLQIKLSGSAKTIKFIGQDGKILHSVGQSSVAHYLLDQNDHYVRCEIAFEDGTLMYLNPVFRYGDEQPLEKNFNDEFKLDSVKTIAFQLLGWILILLWASFVYRRWASVKNTRV